ncbi:hypothetical protein FDP41_001075 [Naegleria fowleri]|uniref:Uncharacterized protein n=1 Tax=Naegleria fowleri TaxID=5763 RepID=A0A6A5BZD8_NAEFO|nr:uncharacterized protein FDP41_001075 [Naegleria fowleri]KAF0979922.1 hypothetical protein FDP41_001075 [Naegleria fowleri]
MGKHSQEAYQLSQEIYSDKYTKDSACRVAIYLAFEGMDLNEMVKEVLNVKAKPGKCLKKILLCSEALLLINIKTGFYYEQANNYCLFSYLFQKNFWSILQTHHLKELNNEQAFETIMSNIKQYAMYGLLDSMLITSLKEGLLMNIQRENKLYIPEQTKKKVFDMMNKLHFVNSLQKTKTLSSLEVTNVLPF